MTAESTPTQGCPTTLAEEHLGKVVWISDTEGFCECPGKNLHTTLDASKDCKIYLIPTATLSCFHSTCRVVVEETLKRIRKSIAGQTPPPTGKKPKMTREQKAQLAVVIAREALRRRAASTSHKVYAEHAWPYQRICDESEIDVTSNLGEHWRMLLTLFAPDDVVWIGSIYDSGKPEHGAHFKTRDDWLKSSAAPGQFTCPSTFTPGSSSRGNLNIATRRFLVVESDELDKDTIGSVFRWMDEKAKIRLRCVVDTAGKSLHGWFDFPSSEELDDLKIILPAFGCDPKMFTPSQPCRMPGAMREDRHQKLIFIRK